MSYLMPDAELEECVDAACGAPEFESWPVRQADLGSGLTVARALPVRSRRRLVGPWCFLDHFGPLEFAARKAMDVAPHPHIGLQTVSWLLAGEALHKDSLGGEAVARPGALNLMTAGHGIAHSEETPERHSGHLHGLQLWVALPDGARDGPAHFDHYVELPVWEPGGGRVQVFMGRLGDVDAGTRACSPLLGADITVAPGSTLELPLEPAWEHALYRLEGDVEVDGTPLATTGGLTWLGTRRAGLALRSRRGARLILIGGAPFGAPIVMWWNFVARDTAEIRAARDAWEAGERFGDVAAYRGARLPAPPLRGRLKASR